MRKLFLLVIALSFLFIIISCNKDTVNTVTVPQETMSVIVGTSQLSISAKASKAFRTFKDTTGKTSTYFSLSITPKTNELPKLNIELYRSVITNTTYTLPIYINTKELNPITGYASASYITSTATYVVDGVHSNGSVTVFTVDSTKVTGNYNFTLVNHADITQKLNIKGEFNLKLYNTAK